MTVERKREAVFFLKAKQVSQRRSCQLILLARSIYQYRTKRAPDVEFETEVKELAVAHPRYGYRRVHALLNRRGQTVNEKRVMRVWQKFGRNRCRRAWFSGGQPAVVSRPHRACAERDWREQRAAQNFDRDLYARRG